MLFCMERKSAGEDAAVNIPMIVAGALFVVWPVQYRHSIRRIRGRVAARSGEADAQRFERGMNRRWIRAALVVAPVLGVVLIVMGVIS